MNFLFTRQKRFKKFKLVAILLSVSVLVAVLFVRTVPLVFAEEDSLSENHAVPERLVLSRVCPTGETLGITYRFPANKTQNPQNLLTEIRKISASGKTLYISIHGHPSPFDLESAICNNVDTTKDIEEILNKNSNILIKMNVRRTKDVLGKVECPLEEGAYVAVTYFYMNKVTNIVRTVNDDRSGMTINLNAILPHHEAIALGCDTQSMIRHFPPRLR